MPVVVMGAYADCVLRERSVSGMAGDKRGEANSGAGDVGPSGEGGMTVGEGTTGASGRVDSADGRSIGEGSESSLMRSSSTLRFIDRSSGVSTSVWSSNVRLYFFLMLPVMLCRAVPVELARRARVLTTGTGEAFTAVLVDAGEGGASVKLVVRRGSLSRLGLNIRGIERRFSSRVEAGEGERGQSSIDMEKVRLVAGRKVAEGAKVGGEDSVGVSVANSLDATQTPEANMNCRSASPVSVGSLSVNVSMKVLTSILEESVVGDCV
jgi:hypothetical protein